MIELEQLFISQLSEGIRLFEPLLQIKLEFLRQARGGIIASYAINYNCELPREKFSVFFLICSWSGLTLFKWQESANPNSTTSFLIQFSFNGLIESPVLKCVKTSPKFALVLERIRTN